MSAPLTTVYTRLIKRRMIVVALFVIALMASFLLDIAVGPSHFPIADVFAGLFFPDSLNPPQQIILWNVRIPYAALAVVVGASLGLAGAEMQTVLNNPLASPYTLGVVSAATFGAALAIVLDPQRGFIGQHWFIPSLAVIFALLAAGLIQILARFYKASLDVVILFGIALVFLCNALVALLQFIANETVLEQIVFWTMGSLARATWLKIAIVALAFIAAFPLAMRQAWSLTALKMGEDQARGIGLHVEKLRLNVLMRVSILSAVAVAFVGAIGFIGLVGPHIARLAIGEDHRFFLPASALAGALVLSLASLTSKSLIPGLIIPVGIVTAMVGIPLLMALILGQRRSL
ncbi:MAG: iron ABC transporter permease [Hyphomicrobiales bacterium]|nr:iron ABC transporter permease [Hyphomicrobiales bacterium]